MGCDLVSQSQRRLAGLPVGNDTIGQSDFGRLDRVDFPSCEDEVERPPLADQPRETDRAAIDERHSKAPTEDPEHGRLAHNSKIAPDGELEPSGNREALHGSHHRLAQRHPRRPERAGAVDPHPMVDFIFQDVEVCPRAEVVTGPCQHGGFDGLVTFEFEKSLVEQQRGLRVDCVAHLWSVDLYHPHITDGLRLYLHRVSLPKLHLSVRRRRYIPPMSEYSLESADPREPDISALLATHLAFSHEQSPPEHVHALDVDGLSGAGVSFYSLRRDGELLAVGALREIGPGHGEIKSMHTTTTARGRGIGRLMLNHLLEVARSRGYSRVSLETGTMEAFAPARRLYESAGFVVTPPFGPYWENEFSVCMTLELTQG